MSERLEMLSDKVRRGEPISFLEAIEVVEYQEQLKQDRKNNSLINKIKKFFGAKNERIHS